MNNYLFEAIDSMDSITIDDVPIDTKVDIVCDFIDKTKELEESREVDVELALTYLCATMSFFMNVHFTNEIDIKIVELMTIALEESHKRRVCD